MWCVLTAAGYDADALAADRALLAQIRAARTVQQQEASEARQAHAAEASAEKAARSGMSLLQRYIRLPDADAAFLDYANALLDRIAATPRPPQPWRLCVSPIYAAS